ncbi:MAG: zinc-ribbon domain-containing protein [Fibrobacter sp.]|nr:zinc-ribbon domain-containing protein [Fibrobacter sp.]
MFCSKCGNELQDGQIFCPKCGVKADVQMLSSVEKSNETKNDESLKIHQHHQEKMPKERQSSPFVPEEFAEDVPQGSIVKKLVIAAVLCLGVFGIYQGVKSPALEIKNVQDSKKTEQELREERERRQQEEQRRREIEEANKRAAQEEAFQNALDFMKSKRDYSSMDLDDLDLQRKLFRLHKTTIQYEYSLEEKQKEKLLRKLTSMRKQEMPRMRKQYAKILSQAIWRENGSASVSGPNNTTINIVHPGFVLNANVEDFNKVYQPQFELFGFKKATFWMYRGASSYASVKYETDDDGTF